MGQFVGTNEVLVTLAPLLSADVLAKVPIAFIRKHIKETNSIYYLSPCRETSTEEECYNPLESTEAATEF